MKRKLTVVMLMVFAALFAVTSCEKEDGGKDTPEDPTPSNPVDTIVSNGDEIIENAVTDIDGNIYDAVKLGGQVWMAENLKTTRYADGTSITVGSDFSADAPYRYYPDGSVSNVAIYGMLYNWAAVMHDSEPTYDDPSGVQGVCPDGWHVPSSTEWIRLHDYVWSQSQYTCGTGNYYIAKSLAAPTGWEASSEPCSPGYDQESNNITGFSALPAGLSDGNVNCLGTYAYFWSSSNFSETNAHARFLCNTNPEFTSLSSPKFKGFSVRCVRD